MSGGGGGGNGMMMAMMMQQQAAQQQAANEAAARQSAESGRQFDITQQANAVAAQRAAEQAAAEQAERQREFDATQSYQSSQAAQAQQYQTQQLQAQREEAQAARQFQLDQIQSERQYQAQLAAQAKAEAQAKLDTWNQGRNAAYQGSLSDALTQLAGKGDTDQSDIDYVKSAFGRANSGIADLSNYSGVFDGLAGTTFAGLTTQKQNNFTRAYNALFPTDFATTKVADTTDDDILNAILSDQKNEATQNAKRLLDRGVITQEGYDSNIKDLAKQSAGALSKLTTIGDNALNSERTALTGIANTGRSAIANYQLGDSFDPNSYQNKVNSAYDTWFSGLDTKLRGLAPTDLFDTSGFLNTAGSVSGPRNSPFVGSTNALTGEDASSTSTDDDKKKNTGSSNALGVF